MTQTRGRSTSLQRGSRSGSAKRGQRANTPRRLSDLPERPAWDATSSNLDRFKLTAEEQERRRASRVSKNRPLGMSDLKRSFVDAWAKHVCTSGVLSDIEPEQDRNRSSSMSHHLPRIDYGSVVEMLRKSPAAAARMSPSLSAALPKEATAPPSRRSGALSIPVTTSSGTDGATDDKLNEVHSESRPHSGALLSAEPSAPPMTSNDSSFISAAEAPASHSSKDRRAAFLKEASGGVGPGATAAAVTGSRHSSTSAAAQALVRGGNPGSANREAEPADEDAKCDVQGSGGAPLYRADVSITPAAPRPRFNPADATTIIAFGEEIENGEDAVTRSNSCSPGSFAAGAVGKVGGGGIAADQVTAAFEAALFGRGGMGEAAQHKIGSSATLAWASSGDVASPRGAAALDAERRLRAVEASSGLSGRDPVLHEELADLRRELRQVQGDNAKLRQELSTFSMHASALMTQLQAQVQQLLRSPAYGSSDGGASRAAAASAAAPLPSTSSSQRSQPGAPRQLQPATAAGTNIATASIPTTVAAAAAAHSALHAAGSHGPFPDLYLSHPVPQPYRSVPQPYQPSEQALLSTEPQPVARRNIFADVNISSLRPVDATAAVRNRSEATPLTTTQRAAGGLTPPAAGPSAASTSPLIDIASVPSASYKVPIRDMDDSDVALPPFAAFKRSAGSFAFTAARPAANGAISGSFSPIGPSTHGAMAAPDPPRLSPPGAHSNITAVQPRPLPTLYQSRSIGGVIVRPASNLSSTAAAAASLPATSVGMTAAAAAGGTNAVGGAYISSLAASATAAMATGSDCAAAALARTHSGMPQPLVFSVAPEFRIARTTGLSAENSMSLSAHTAAAASLRSKTSLPAGVGKPR